MYLLTQGFKCYIFSCDVVHCRCSEFCDQGFWLPGGAVDPGEVFTAAAKRECMEEAGVEIDLKGVLAIEMHPYSPR
jgi:hypothetical protein